MSLQIQELSFSTIHEEAWSLAEILNQPRAYDTHYLALARHYKCACWTADERFYNVANMKYPEVQWLGNIKP
jgi:predicted nucleic acid-binding protein